MTVLFFEPEQGLRRVTTSTCAEAVRTASLLLKLGSDGALPLDAPPSPPAVAAPPPPAQPTTPAEAPWYFSLGAGPAFDVGAFATVETRIAISASATRELLRFALDARVGLPRSVATDLTAMRVVELQGAGCLNLSWRSLAGGPCLAMSAGSWSVDARWGKSRTVMTAAVGAQLRLSAILVPGLGLELSAVGGVRFNVARPVVIVADSKVFAMALIGADLQLALGWRW